MSERVRRGFEIFGQFVAEDEALKLYLELKKHFEPVKVRALQGKLAKIDLQVLKMINEGRRVSEIIKELNVKKRAVYSIIERQMRKGYMSRAERGKYMLTDEGKKIIATPSKQVKKAKP